MKLYIASVILAIYSALIFKVISQQHQIIELQKDRQKFTLSMDYLAIVKGVTDRDIFPIKDNGFWKCVPVDTN